MILGIGNDIVSIPRIARIVQTTSRGHAFIRRILHPSERKVMATRFFGGDLSVLDNAWMIQTTTALTPWIAGRWALKEAVAKMLGCGIGSLVSFHDIRIEYSTSGQPLVTLSTSAQERLALVAPIRIHVALTHDADVAYATAIGELLLPR